MKRLAAVSLALFSCTRPEVAQRVAPPVSSPREQKVARLPGSAHLRSIGRVTLDAGGSAAITVDDSGAVRLWTSLDGADAPLPIPVETERTALDAIDLRRGPGRTFRVAASVDGNAQVFDIDTRGRVTRAFTMDGVTAARLLPGGRILVARGAVVSVHDREGAQLSAVRLDGPVAAVLAPPSGEAFVAVTGSLRTTEVLQYWQDKPNLSVFEGTLVALRLERGGGLSARLPMTLTAVNEPNADSWAISDDARRVAFSRWRSLDVEAETDLSSDIELVDLASVTRAQIGPEQYGAPRIAFTPEGTLEWDGMPGETTVLRDRTSRTAGATESGVLVEADGNWLHVTDDQGERWLGAQRFAPHTVAYSPGGERIAWATNYGGEEAVAPTLQLTDPNEDGVPAGVPLKGLKSVAGMAWIEPGTLLVVEREGQLHTVNPESGEATLLDRIEGEPATLEHDAASGVSLVRSRYEEAWVLVAPHGDRPAVVLSLESLTSEDWLVGLVHGGDGGIWVLGEAGLAVLGLDEVRAGGASPRFEALKSDARRAFGVTWTARGERIVDWGDRWEVAGGGYWLRDTPVFGPLRPAPEGSGVLTLPECDDSPWRVAVHPGPPSELAAGTSWMHVVPKHSVVAWAPDGSRIAVAGGEDGGSLLDVRSRKVIRRWHASEFSVRDSEPAMAAKVTGRCRSFDELMDEEEYAEYEE